MRTFKRCALIFPCLIVLYVLSLALIECIPNDRIDYHVDLGCQQLWQEGSKPTGYGGEAGAQLDNATDVLMLQRAVRDSSQDAFTAAMDQQDYARYWHGYLLVLRPLLKFFSYPDVRVLNYFAILMLAFACFYHVAHRLGGVAGAGFALSLLMGFISVVPLSMQYVNIFCIVLLSCLLMLCKNEGVFRLGIAPFFLIIGSVTNFFDFLTVPLLTLGYPLVLLLYFKSQEDNACLSHLMRALFMASVCWALGYGLTWASKWLIGSLTLGRNVISEALASILHRTLAAGDQVEYPLDYREVFLLNLKNFLPRGARVAFLLVFIACALHLLGHGLCMKRLPFCFPFVIVALLPYAWYLVLGNHSQVHAWFTYRNQMMSVFALFGAMNALKKTDHILRDSV